MARSRSSWLYLLLALLVLANVVYYFISGWGLITIHAQDQPLKDIVRSIERQGHATLVTNIDPERKVNMWVTRVPLLEALETLAAVTDSRWSLLYVLAPNGDKLQEGLAQITKPEPTPDWKRQAVPLPPFVNVQSAEPIDPRIMRWRVEAPATPNLQEYLTQGSLSADVAFYFPADWNPAIAKPPASDTIRNVVKNLASTVAGTNREVFFLSEMRRQPRPEGGERPREMWQGLDFSRIEERVQQQIAQLPQEEQKEAREAYDARKAFFTSLANLTPEQRREKMREFFQSPENQERMESRDARRTPEQRASRNARYTAGKAAAKGQ